MRIIFYLLVLISTTNICFSKSSIKPVDYYTNKIRPIFEKRCITCHACYESPCQLKLTSYEGLTRGAIGVNPYGSDYSGGEQIRLFKDGLSETDWRQKGFYSVVDQNSESSPEEKLDNSLLYKFVLEGFKTHGLNDEFKTISRRKAKNCVASTADYNDLKPKTKIETAMPFGMKSVTGEEFEELRTWIELGAPGPNKSMKKWMHTAHDKITNAGIVKIETILNNPNLKYRWAAKYFYEHTYSAHFSFNSKTREFFEILRSSTPFPKQIKEVVTKFPFDDPKIKIYYRFNKIHSSIVHKNHIVFNLSDHKINRFVELFIKDNSWGEDLEAVNYVSANPFVNFKSIPPKIRYTWMIENAHYLIDAFSRGPVCKGAGATSLVRDYFHALFLSPDVDPTIQDPEFLKNNAKLLGLPELPEGKDINYFKYNDFTQEYLNKKNKLIEANLKNNIYSVNDIWIGSGKSVEDDKNSFLTLFRHKEGVSVFQGKLGPGAKTAWVFDYPIFERLYYILVPSFNQFGTLNHRLRTRVYSEKLRIEAVSNFLKIFPQNIRQEVRHSIYDGVGGFIRRKFIDGDLKIKNKNISKLAKLTSYQSNLIKKNDKLSATKIEQKVNIVTENVFLLLNSNYKRNLLTKFNYKSNYVELNNEPNNQLSFVEQELSRISKNKGYQNQFFPEISYLYIRKNNVLNKIYTMTLNRAFYYSNLSVLKKQRKADDDTLYIFKNMQTSRPRNFYIINEENIKEFVNDLLKVKGGIGYQRFARKYAISKSDNRFWEVFDNINLYFKKNDPLNYGVFDMSKYEKQIQQKYK